MNIKNIILHESSQTKKITYLLIPFYMNFEKRQNQTTGLEAKIIALLGGV